MKDKEYIPQDFKNIVNGQLKDIRMNGQMINQVKNKRIIDMKKKESYSMKKSFVAASIIGILLLGTTVAYASGLFKRFFFSTDKGTVVITTSEDLTQKELNQKVEDYMNLPEEISEDVEVIEPTVKEYASVEDAEKELDFKVILPNEIPEGYSQNGKVRVSIQPVIGETFVEMSFRLDQGPLFKVTIIKKAYAEGTAVNMRPTPDETYISDKHIEYSITKEEDEIANKTYFTATAYIDNVEYSIFENGMEESVFYNMLNSIDLTAYSNN